LALVAAVMLGVAVLAASAQGEVVTPHAVKPTVVAPQPVAPQIVTPADAGPAPAPAPESAPEAEFESSSVDAEPARASAPVGIASCDGRGCPEQIPKPPPSEPSFPLSWEPLERVREVFIGRLVCPWYFAGFMQSVNELVEASNSGLSPTEIDQSTYDAVERGKDLFQHVCINLREP